MKRYTAALIFCGLALLPTLTFAAEQLIFAVDVIRHGDRTPIEALPTSSYQWPQGLGVLTPLGMRQEYQLGVAFRKLYVDQYHLLPRQFNLKNMVVYSDTDSRTMQSAEALLYGLYPPGTGPKIANLSGVAQRAKPEQFALPGGYQPIPVFSTMRFGAASLAPSAVKAYQALLQQQAFSSAKWQAQEQQWQNQFARLRQITGFKIHTFADLMPIGEDLFIDQIHHLAYPPGISAPEAKQLMVLSKQLVAEKYAPPAIGLLLSAALLHQIKDYLSQAASSAANSTDLKYVLFSAHDTTILALLSALKMPLSEQPPYASDVKILLFQDAKAQDFVQMFYNGKLLKLPFCQNQTQCPLSEFIKVL